MDHWALHEDQRAEVARIAKAQGVDLRNADTFQEVFGVEALHHFPGSVQDAQQHVRDWALNRETALVDKLVFDKGTHREARAIAWTNVTTPAGTQINVTAREGASSDSIVATVLALTGALRALDELGFTTSQKAR
jgi:hypothetical protein